MARKRQRARNKLANELKKPSQSSAGPDSTSPPPQPPSPPPPPPSPPPPPPDNIILDAEINPELLKKWPKLQKKIPPIFLHKPADFEKHVKMLLHRGIKFYQPHLGKNFTKITCESNNDHSNMMQYFQSKKLPFHTFGDPLKRKMKVVIRGLPKDIELNKIKQILKSVSIPVIRVHKMHTKVERADNTILVLAVVPYDDEGKAILKVRQILGHNVKLEPPHEKPRQCYRCQKWGHSQRYCHGKVTCVKCAGEHWTKKCDRNSEDEPPKCANCSEDHTASYKECVSTPGSIQYGILQEYKVERKPSHKPNHLVTMENRHKLYKNVNYNKSNKPVFPVVLEIPHRLFQM